LQGSLFVFGGEFTPSAQGHEGAGEYHRDAWLFSIAEQTWSEVSPKNVSSVPSARGWFNTAALPDGRSVVIFGGFDGEGRISDTWKISFQ